MSFLLVGMVFVFLVLVFQDAFEVMLLPRRTQRRVRLTRIYFRPTWATWAMLAILQQPATARQPTIHAKMAVA